MNGYTQFSRCFLKKEIFAKERKFFDYNRATAGIQGPEKSSDLRQLDSYA